MTNELKPCPFCGGDAVSKKWHQRYRPKHYMHSVSCLECGASITEDLTIDRKANPIAAWNNRYERTCKPIDKYCCGVPLCGNCGVDLNMIVSGVRPFNKILPNFCHMCGSKVVSD